MNNDVIIMNNGVILMFKHVLNIAKSCLQSILIPSFMCFYGWMSQLNINSVLSE